MRETTYTGDGTGLMPQTPDSNVGDEYIVKRNPNLIEIPDNATNGEMLCLMFPDMHYTLSDKSPRVVTTIGIAASFDIDWWNAPYKKGEGD